MLAVEHPTIMNIARGEKLDRKSAERSQIGKPDDPAISDLISPSASPGENGLFDDVLYRTIWYYWLINLVYSMHSRSFRCDNKRVTSHHRSRRGNNDLLLGIFVSGVENKTNSSIPLQTRDIRLYTGPILTLLTNRRDICHSFFPFMNNHTHITGKKVENIC